jgi:hypothetical protein
MVAKKHSPLLVGLLMLALLLPLGASSLAQTAQPVRAAAPDAAVPSAPVTTPTVILEGDSAGAAHGSSADNAGDVNGDGYADLIVGAPLADVLAGESTLADAGIVSVYYGSAAGLAPTASLTLSGAQSGEQFGYAVAGVGDVNGDGYGDVAASAIYYDTATDTDAGRVAVYLGSAGGLSNTPQIEITGQAGSEFGHSIDGGLVNGDTSADLIVGAPTWDNGETDEGVAIVYYGSASGITTAGATTLEMSQAGAHFGHNVAFAGDTDGEGFGDVIVGAPMYDNGETDEGAAFLFDGGSTSVETTAGWTYECNIAAAMCGEAVAGNGSLNGDAFADLVVGAPGAGEVYAFLGSATGLSTAPDSTVTGAAADEFGGAVAFAGDTNGDGYDDVLIGSPAAAGAGADSGAATLYYGTAAGLSATSPWSATDSGTSDMFGAAVAGGDFNNDGFSDLAIGSPGRDFVERTDAGAVSVYAGAADATPTATASVTAIAPCLGTATPHVPSGNPPTAGLSERQVANCYDDASERTDTGIVYPLQDAVTTGRAADGSPYSGGFLFRNPDIPEGSRVVSATLQLYAVFQSGLPVELTIAGDNTGQAEDFYGGLRDISSRPRTSTVVSFTVPSRIGGWLNSPDLAGVVQEILDRGDWVAGNNLALLIDPAPNNANTYATWASYERSPQLAARLLVRYEPPPTATPTVTDTPTATATPTVTLTPTASATPTESGHKLYLPIVVR